jgi:hypothetical protein
VVTPRVHLQPPWGKYGAALVRTTIDVIVTAAWHVCLLQENLR